MDNMISSEFNIWRFYQPIRFAIGILSKQRKDIQWNWTDYMRQVFSPTFSCLATLCPWMIFLTANKMKHKIFFIWALTLSVLGNAQTITPPQEQKPVNLGNAGFYENKGQIVDQNYKPNPDVKYLLCSSYFNVQLRQTGFSYDTYMGTDIGRIVNWF